MGNLILPGAMPRLQSGSGPGGVCAQQAVEWLVNGVFNAPNVRTKDGSHPTDHPSCVQPYLNVMTITANDQLEETDRQKLWPLILRQINTARPAKEPWLTEQLQSFHREWMDKKGLNFDSWGIGQTAESWLEMVDAVESEYERIITANDGLFKPTEIPVNRIIRLGELVGTAPRQF